MQQSAVNEWLIMDEECMKYHMKQHENPYRSTVAFNEFIKKYTAYDQTRIVDMGCGAGAVLRYFIDNNPGIGLAVGVDFNEEVVNIGNEIFRRSGISNCQLEVGDIYNFNPEKIGNINGIISTMVLLALPGYKEILKCWKNLNPDWMAFSILGFEGLIDYDVKLFDYTKDKDGDCAEVYYNIYSLPRMKEYLKELGYTKFEYQKFEIDIDLPKTNNLGRGTYTVKTEEGSRIQISGGMMMPWYFVFAGK